MSHIFVAAASQEDPARNDSVLGRAVNVPANPLPVIAAPAAFPAAIQPGQIQILSGVSHSSSRKRKTVESATAPPTVAHRNPTDILEIFLATQERERIHADTVTLTASLVAINGLPDSENKRRCEAFVFQALSSNIQKLSSCVPPPVPPPPVVNADLICSICRDTIEFLAARNTYIQATFTLCGHGFHSSCLQSHRDNGDYGSYDKCPDCRAPL